jgi:hypothetical protein
MLMRRRNFWKGVILGAIAGCLVWGCGGPQRWTKPGITEAGFAADMASCRRQTSREQAPNWGQSHDLEHIDRYTIELHACMESRGYRLAD